jgi:hypothetical protein
MVKVLEQVTGAVSRLGVKANYGDPVEVGGTELVPVSLVWMGFGGGQDGEENSAGGGGGGGASIPVGAYVPGIDGPEFRPNLVTFLAVSTVAICVTGHALARIIRAFK